RSAREGTGDLVRAGRVAERDAAPDALRGVGPHRSGPGPSRGRDRHRWPRDLRAGPRLVDPRRSRGQRGGCGNGREPGLREAGMATKTKDELIESIRADQRFWRELVAEVGPARYDEPGPMGAWTFGDTAGHLLGWRNRTISR